MMNIHGCIQITLLIILIALMVGIKEGRNKS
ncbi:hypothetical protein IIO_06403 [Bacillus cereus VD115]|nr:hypothetical protein IIO_06403 [Bacillus cereus VD115]